MIKSDLEQSYLLLVRFLMLSKRRAFEMGAVHGLTGMQAMMLFLLDKPHPMFSFKNILNCDASNITGIIDGLEDKKLVSRYPSPDDRRIKMVRLTTKGTRLRQRFIESATGRSSTLSKLNKQELKTFTDLLKKITNGSVAL